MYVSVVVAGDFSCCRRSDDVDVVVLEYSDSL